MTMSKWIEYGETENCDTRIEKETEPRYQHSFRLTALKPDTTYYFRISRPENHIEDKVDIYNAGVLIPELVEKDEKPIYSFRTAPRCPDGSRTETCSFEFCVTSDLHCTGTNIEDSLATMAAHSNDMRFLTVTGDITNHGGEESAWNSFFYQLHPYTHSKDLNNPALLSIPGNHDSDHVETYAHYIHAFDHPYEDQRKGGNYYVVYGNAVFIMLDTCNAGRSQGPQGLIAVDQMQWLGLTLKAFAKKHYWIFVCLHHQIYSTGYKNGMIKAFETAYLDLFSEYQVDAVFYGHDHHFEVYWQNRASAWGGTHYYLVGNGGTMLTNLEEMKRRKPNTNYVWTRKTYLVHRDGILNGNPNGARNDEAIRDAFQYGLIETMGFLNVRIHGDVCEVRMIGSRDGTVYYRDEFRRTGTGKTYHRAPFVKQNVD